MWNGRLLSEIKRPKNQAIPPFLHTKKIRNYLDLAYPICYLCIDNGMEHVSLGIIFLCQSETNLVTGKAFPIAIDKIFHYKRCSFHIPDIPAKRFFSSSDKIIGSHLLGNHN